MAEVTNMNHCLSLLHMREDRGLLFTDRLTPEVTEWPRSVLL